LGGDAGRKGGQERIGGGGWGKIDPLASVMKNERTLYVIDRAWQVLRSVKGKLVVRTELLL
jgi:hypothetical protein